MRAASSPSSRLDCTDLQALLTDPARPQAPYALLRSLLDAGYGDLPLPGSGRTLERWQALATVAQHDLGLAKRLESHADALAILHELNQARHCQAGQIWAVWCAESAGMQIRAAAADGGGGAVRLLGTKAWCSGAAHVSHAVVSVRDDWGRPRLAALALAQPSIRITRNGRGAMDMAATAGVDIVFDAALAQWVGEPGAYFERPGFQHGAAGIAACWYGASCAIAEQVRRSARQHTGDPHRFVRLGTVDLALVQARSQLRRAAAEIDANPHSGCEHAVRSARLAVDLAAKMLLYSAPRALGAAPMSWDQRYARMLADLPVFIRESRAERDLAEHGKSLSELAPGPLWTL